MTGSTDVEQMIEARLAEIEEQLRPYAELEQERERLRRALSALRNEPGSADTGAPRRGGNARGARRAARGSNLKAIVAYVTDNPGATSGEIASATGISRGVVYSAVSRLTNAGRLARSPKGDGQVAYTVID
jgi:sugar-specific transcriptional regulator TrmB